MSLPVLPSDFNPAQALTDDRAERFCHLRATGVNLGRCFELTFSATHQPKSLEAMRAAGWRKSHEPAIVERIKWLRANPPAKQTPAITPTAPPPPPTRLDRHGLLQLMGEVTEALSTAARALSEAGSSPKTIAKLRGDLVVHVRRLDRLRPASAPPSGGTVEFDAMLARARAQWCRCEVIGGGP